MYQPPPLFQILTSPNPCRVTLQGDIAPRPDCLIPLQHDKEGQPCTPGSPGRRAVAGGARPPRPPGPNHGDRHRGRRDAGAHHRYARRDRPAPEPAPRRRGAARGLRHLARRAARRVDPRPAADPHHRPARGAEGRLVPELARAPRAQPRRVRQAPRRRPDHPLRLRERRPPARHARLDPYGPHAPGHLPRPRRRSLRASPHPEPKPERPVVDECDCVGPKAYDCPHPEPKG